MCVLYSKHIQSMASASETDVIALCCRYRRYRGISGKCILYLDRLNEHIECINTFFFIFIIHWYQVWCQRNARGGLRSVVLIRAAATWTDFLLRVLCWRVYAREAREA